MGFGELLLEEAADVVAGCANFFSGAFQRLDVDILLGTRAHLNDLVLLVVCNQTL